MNTKLQQGFTLIELMIVIAIIGILAAVAIPAYQDYIARSQVSEAFTSVEGVKTGLAEAVQNNGAFPSNTASYAVTGKYGTAGVDTIGSTTTLQGRITYTFASSGVNAAIATKKVIFLSPTIASLANATTFNWDCKTGGTDVPSKYLPKNCQ